MTLFIGSPASLNAAAAAPMSLSLRGRKGNEIEKSSMEWLLLEFNGLNGGAYL